MANTLARLQSLSQRFTKDRIGALLLLVLGACVTVTGTTYRIGTLNHMGAGFIPVTLGVLLLGVGAAIGLTSAPPKPPSPSDPKPLPPEWRGWLCILGGVAAFVVLGEYGGMMPAIFASVFISAMGDRKNSVRDAALLALAMAIAGALIFSWGLHMQLPLFAWS